MEHGEPRTLILDVGKTNTKVCVVDQEGATVARNTRDTPISSAGDYPHVDIDTLGGWVIDAIDDLAQRFAIKTVVPVAHGACAAIVSGVHLALPIMDYEWPGVAEIDDAYDRIRPPFIETGSPALARGLNLGRQLYWLQTSYSTEFESAGAILFYPQFWAWFLSGARVCEVTSPGAHSDLWNPHRRDFSSLVTRAGWRSMLPPLRSAWETAGFIRPSIAHQTGLADDCVVKTGVHDSNASYLRHLVGNETPFTVVSTGTWVIVMAAGGAPSRVDEDRDMLANVDVYGDPVPSARFMGGREYSQIAGEDGLNASIECEDVARIITRGSMALPSFVEAGGPFSQRHGELIGPPADNARDGAALATLYCTLVTDYTLSLLGADRSRIIVEGSFARNVVFCRVLAQLCGHPIRVSSDETGTVSGAALLTNDGGPVIQPASTQAVDPAQIPSLDAYREAWRSRCE